MKQIPLTLIFTFFCIVAFGQCYPVASQNCSNPNTTFTYTYYTNGGTGPTCTGGTGATTVHGYCGYSNSQTVPSGDAGDYPACYYQAHGQNISNDSVTNCTSQAPINSGLLFLIIAGIGAGVVTFYSKEKSKLIIKV